MTYFRRAFPGEVGQRNVLRGDGYYSIDLSLSKTWSMPWAKDQRLRFRWDTFNLTNTPKFDVQFLDVYPDRANTFGRYLQHDPDVRRRRRALHAVRAQVRILGQRIAQAKAQAPGCSSCRRGPAL